MTSPERIAHWHRQADRIHRTIDNLRRDMERHGMPSTGVLPRLDCAYSHTRGAADILANEIGES